MVQLLAGIISLRRVLEANPGRSHGSADTLPLRHSAKYIPDTYFSQNENTFLTLDVYICSNFDIFWSSDALWRHKPGSTLVQVILAQEMSCYLTAPRQYLNQYKQIIKEVWRYSSGGIFAGNAQDILILGMSVTITNFLLQTNRTRKNGSIEISIDEV